jgi:hypothetical protein
MYKQDTLGKSCCMLSQVENKSFILSEDLEAKIVNMNCY